MKGKIPGALALTVIMCVAVFAALKDDDALKRITPLPAKYAEMSKAAQRYEGIGKEIKAELDRITKTYLGNPAGGNREMTPEEAMARYGGMGGGMSVTDIQLMPAIQECQTYLITDFIKENQKFGTAMNSLDAEIQKALDAEKKKFEEKTKHLCIDGEGANEKSIAEYKKANAEYMAAQSRVYEGFIPRMNKLMEDYRTVLAAAVTRSMAAYNKAFAETKNNTILTQAASLRSQILGLISDFAEIHRAKAAWQPENMYRY